MKLNEVLKNVCEWHKTDPVKLSTLIVFIVVILATLLVTISYTLSYNSSNKIIEIWKNKEATMRNQNSSGITESRINNLYGTIREIDAFVSERTDNLKVKDIKENLKNVMLKMTKILDSSKTDQNIIFLPVLEKLQNENKELSAVVNNLSLKKNEIEKFINNLESKIETDPNKSNNPIGLEISIKKLMRIQKI